MARVRSERWFRKHRPQEATPERAVVLLLFPFVGGSARAFDALARHLGPMVEPWSIELPGRGARFGEPLETDIVDVATAIAAAFGERTTPRCALFGHSLGARIAFETARALRRGGGNEPVAFFASASAAPDAPRPGLATDDDDALYALLRQFGGTSSQLLDHPEFRNAFLPILRADYRLLESYAFAPDAPLRCPMRAFAGVHDQQVPVADVERWRDHTSGRFDLVRLEAAHFYLESHAREVASLVEDVVLEAIAAG